MSTDDEVAKIGELPTGAFIAVMVTVIAGFIMLFGIALTSFIIYNSNFKLSQDY
jgi:hypothetical protein